MRSIAVSSVQFGAHTFDMLSFVNPWGEDDVVLANMRTATFNETDTLAWWLAMLAIAPAGALCLDVGAYSGIFSLLAAKARADMRCLAFEASALTYGRLTHNIMLNGFGPQILPIHLAVSSPSGRVELSHSFGVLTMASGESLLSPDRVDHVEPVLATTLDEALGLPNVAVVGNIASRSADIFPIQNISCAKIDVEGAEGKVLAGAGQMLDKFHPYLIIEILEPDKVTQCREVLDNHDYQLLAVCPGQNYVFAHAPASAALAASYDHLATDLTSLQVRDRMTASL